MTLGGGEKCIVDMENAKLHQFISVALGYCCFTVLAYSGVTP